MTQRSMFFDSVSNDRIYTSDAWAQIYAALYSDGVVSGYGSSLVVTEKSPQSLGVNVGLGAAWVQGRQFQVYSAVDPLTLAIADVSNPRIDRIVIRVDMTARTASLAVKAGTPAASPTAPVLTQTAGGTWETSLAQVRVNAGVTSVTNANITDERAFTRSSSAVAFGIVKSDATNITSTIAGDTVQFVSGANIALTPDTVNKKVTVAVTGTVPAATFAIGATNATNAVNAATANSATTASFATNADKLDNLDSTAFALVGHNHDGRYLRMDGTVNTVTAGIVEARNTASYMGMKLTSGPASGGFFPYIDLADDTSGVSDVRVQLVGGTRLDVASTVGDGMTINGVYAATIAGARKIFVQNTAPAATALGDIWVDTSVTL